MKAKVKHQEVEYIQYDGTNREEIEEFIGQQCHSCNEDINRPLVPWLHFTYNDVYYDVYRNQYVIKVDNEIIAILWKSDFLKMFEPINS